MGFWRYLSEGPEGPETRWKTTKFIAAAVIVFLIVPILLYSVIKWDPVIYVSEDGDPSTLGFLVVLGLYWVGAYFAYKGWKAERRLNRLLGTLYNYDETIRLFKAWKDRRRYMGDSSLYTIEDELNAQERERHGQ